MANRVEVVGKIGSMALIRREDNDIDYNIFSRLGAELSPGMVWVTSGATEIGRLDYIKRHGCELDGDIDHAKTDYAAQGQAILMATYRQFVRPEVSIRQVLLEHTHFNDPDKRAHIRELFLRAAEQGAVPIVNYNDPVSFEENRKMEIAALQAGEKVRAEGSNAAPVECVDNDETAAVIARIVGAKTLVIMTSADGIYRDPTDPATLVREVYADTPQALEAGVRKLQESCVGASRAGANGARAKLEYMLGPALQGTLVIIGHGRHRISDLLDNKVPCTRIGLR